MSPNRSPIPRNTGCHVTGALMLTLLSCGLTLHTTPALAQPTPTQPDTSKSAALTPEQNAEIERVMSISRYEEFCKQALDLKLENATIEEAITRIKTTFPSKQVEIRQRDARPLKVSLDLKETTVGTVLTGIATLADCKLWVLPDHLLIAPPGQLNSAEKKMIELRQAGEWWQSTESGGHGWSNLTFARKAIAIAVAQEVKAKGLTEIKTTFGSFSPQIQGALQKLVNFGRMGPLILSPESPVTVNLTDPKWVTIECDAGATASNSSSGGTIMNIRVQP